MARGFCCCRRARLRSEASDLGTRTVHAPPLLYVNRRPIRRLFDAPDVAVLRATHPTRPCRRRHGTARAAAGPAAMLARVKPRSALPCTCSAAVRVAGVGGLGTRQVGHARALHALERRRQPIRAPQCTAANASAADSAAEPLTDSPFHGGCCDVNDSTFSDALRLRLQPAGVHRHDVRSARPQHAAAEFEMAWDFLVSWDQCCERFSSEWFGAGLTGVAWTGVAWTDVDWPGSVQWARRGGKAVQSNSSNSVID